MRRAETRILAAVLPALDTLRGMRGGYDEREDSTPIALTFGLYQGAKLGRRRRSTPMIAR